MPERKPNKKVESVNNFEFGSKMPGKLNIKKRNKGSSNWGGGTQGKQIQGLYVKDGSSHPNPFVCTGLELSA